MLDLVYHKRNPLFTIAVDSSILKKNLKTNLRKKYYKKILSLLGCYNDEIIINT